MANGSLIARNSMPAAKAAPKYKGGGMGGT
jgi:hypothetical protein